MTMRDEARAVLTCRGGWWVRDPSTMTAFSGEGTADGDQEAIYLREWYEANREKWWERSRWGWLAFAIGGPAPRTSVYESIADDFILSMKDQARIIADARAKSAQFVV